jgi:hypothetical protein
MEKEKSWRRPEKLESSHDSLHTIVLRTKEAEKKEPELTTNERLAKMEEKFGKLEEKLQASLDKQEKLEGMLEKVITAVTRAA